MDWIELVAWPFSAVIAGFVGGWTVAWRWGARLQRIEDRVNQAEMGLINGKPRVRRVPILETQLDTLTKEVRDLRAEMREDRKQFQTRDVCEERHRGDT